MKLLKHFWKFKDIFDHLEFDFGRTSFTKDVQKVEKI